MKKEEGKLRDYFPSIVGQWPLYPLRYVSLSVFEAGCLELVNPAAVARVASGWTSSVRGPGCVPRKTRCVSVHFVGSLVPVHYIDPRDMAEDLMPDKPGEPGL